MSHALLGVLNLATGCKAKMLSPPGVSTKCRCVLRRRNTTTSQPALPRLPSITASTWSICCLSTPTGPQPSGTPTSTVASPVNRTCRRHANGDDGSTLQPNVQQRSSLRILECRRYGCTSAMSACTACSSRVSNSLLASSCVPVDARMAATAASSSCSVLQGCDAGRRIRLLLSEAGATAGHDSCLSSKHTAAPLKSVLRSSH